GSTDCGEKTAARNIKDKTTSLILRYVKGFFTGATHKTQAGQFIWSPVLEAKSLLREIFMLWGGGGNARGLHTYKEALSESIELRREGDFCPKIVISRALSLLIIVSIRFFRCSGQLTEVPFVA
ncbi:MAG: hypothetical protein ACE1ZE_02840, partial [Candidatus Binatia bacterium]